MTGLRLRAVLGAGAVVAGLAAAGCSDRPVSETPEAPPAARQSILLVTLDTTRADAVEPECDRVETPALAALAARGLRFTRAYATAPQTLPAHASMMTGLYPAGHGVHENGRRLDDRVPTLAARLGEAGYATAAFVSGFPLDRRFGLARGFDRYDDALAAGGAAPAETGGEVERSAADTTGRALAFLNESLDRAPANPLFVWVHYYDPHHPYAPPEPFGSRYAAEPYLGEIAAMDRELGRLVAAFESRTAGGGWAIVVAGDHGEGLGDHGEALHGNLLYQGVMRVPLLIAGSGVQAGVRDQPVSTRRVFDTVLALAGVEPGASAADGAGEAADGGASADTASSPPASLLEPGDEIVLAEAMQPFLAYGWQPQVMAASGRYKLIRAGGLELYDVDTDPEESQNLVGDLQDEAEEEGEKELGGEKSGGDASTGSGTRAGGSGGDVTTRARPGAKGTAGSGGAGSGGPSGLGEAAGTGRGLRRAGDGKATGGARPGSQSSRAAGDTAAAGQESPAAGTPRTGVAGAAGAGEPVGAGTTSPYPARLFRDLLRAARDYPLPTATPDEPAPPSPADREARRRLAALGYVTSEVRQPLRPDAPAPREMTRLFADLDRGSGLFVRGEYAAAIPVFERLAAADPHNLMVALRLAVAHSALGHRRQALDWFDRAGRIAPGSDDVRHYLAMHLLSAGEPERAAPLFERVLAADPDRLPALAGLARAREAEGRPAEAAALVERAVAVEGPTPAALARLGGLRMAAGDTPAAIRAFEAARDLDPGSFDRWLELGVLYLAARRLPEARDALDRVPPADPGYPMALFKRAQVAVLLAEPDRAERVRLALDHADGTTRGLIESEPLFRDLPR